MAVLEHSPGSELKQRSTSQRPRRSPKTARFVIAGIGGVLLLVWVVLFGAFSYSEWKDRIADAEKLTVNMSDVLSEHAGRVLDAADLIATHVARSTPADWNDDAAWRHAFSMVEPLAGTFSYISAVWIFDAAGRARLSNREAFAPPDRIEVDALQRQDGAVPGPFVGRLRGEMPGTQPPLVLSRRIEAPSGTLRGLVAVVIDEGYLHAFYRSLQPEYPVAIDLFDVDRRIVLHFPELPSTEAAHRTKWPERPSDMPLGESGILYRVAGTDGLRLESYERVSHFPLYVGVSTSWDVIFRRWLEETLRDALVALAALAGLLLLVAIAMSRAKREEDARSELEALAGTLEQRVGERTEELERSAARLQALLAEKDVLFREVHHRVKNNLQIISSLLNLYAAKFRDPDVQRSFTDCVNQVRAMGLVHELLYRSPNVARVDFGEYLGVLANRLSAYFGAGSQVRIEIRAVPLHFDLDTTTPLALIAAEAITNAFKHAFPDGRLGMIAVHVESDAGGMRMTIRDDGVGMPPGIDAQNGGALGFRLMRVLAEQLDGSLEIRGDHGTAVTFYRASRPEPEPERQTVRERVSAG